MRNYQKELEKLIDNIPEGSVPTLLLHACCAPCSSYCLEYLSNYFKITLYFYNPNIYPENEYSLRTDEARRLISEMSFKNEVTFLEGSFDPKEFYEYFEAGEWVDSEGKPVISWKQKFITWESRRRKNGKPDARENLKDGGDSKGTGDDWSKFYSAY